MSIPITARVCKKESENFIKNQEVLEDNILWSRAKDDVDKITQQCLKTAQTTIHQKYDWPIPESANDKYLSYIREYLIEMDYDIYLAEDRGYLIVSWGNI